MNSAKKSVKKELWITNISNKNVGISDLAIYIKPFASINLLDDKHYHFTNIQIKQSIETGSISKKQGTIVIRKFAPETLINPLKINNDATLPTRQRSSVEIEHKEYEELEISDEEFANQNSELEKT